MGSGITTCRICSPGGPEQTLTAYRSSLMGSFGEAKKSIIPCNILLLSKPSAATEFDLLQSDVRQTRELLWNSITII